MPDVPSLPAGRRVLVDILARDELALDLSARFVEVLAGETQPLADDEVFAEETAEEALEESAEAAALDEQAGSSVGGDGTEPAADALDPPAAGT